MCYYTFTREPAPSPTTYHPRISHSLPSEDKEFMNYRHKGTLNSRMAGGLNLAYVNLINKPRVGISGAEIRSAPLLLHYNSGT